MMKRAEYNTLIFSLLVFSTIIQISVSFFFKFPFSWGIYLTILFLVVVLLVFKVDSVALIFKDFFEKLQRFNNLLFMGFVYFIILSPVGFLRRTVLGHKVRTSVKKDVSTYLEDPGVKSQDFTRPF